MCSIAIPAELLLGHSPPVYSSIFYNSLMVTTPSIANRSVPPQIRPCLSSGSLQLDRFLDKNDDISNDPNKRNKKKVVFADDRGRPLTQVRVMSEPSNMPPLWTTAYVSNLTKRDIFRNLDCSFISQNNFDTDVSQQVEHMKNIRVDVNPWEANFPQPASDYLTFRSKLDRNALSLENVIIRETDNCVIGTIKVKNLAYDKEVSIRITTDNWISFKDIPAVYVEIPGLIASTAVRNLYDTFRFSIPLPNKNSSAHQLEFCVRYFTDGKEFWDNNNGVNYIIKKKRNVTVEEEVAQLLSSCCGPSIIHDSFTQNSADQNNKVNQIRPAGEAARVQLRTWSEFASWQHLDNDAPYW